MDKLHRAVLGTARLELRPLRAEDADFVISGVGRLMVSRYLSTVPHPYGRADFDDFLKMTSPGEYWAIEDAQGFAGVISLTHELGFWIAPDRQGRGYVTEAARAVLALHFADPEAGPVASRYFADNRASAAVHRRLGFRTVGIESRMCRALGQARPNRLQRLSREDFLAAEAQTGQAGADLLRKRA